MSSPHKVKKAVRLLSAKSIMVGVIVGLIIGSVIGYAIQAIEITKLKQQITQLNDQITILEKEIIEKDDKIRELEEQLSDPYPVAPFLVSGRYILDSYGRRVSLKGFQLDEGKMTGESGFRGTGVYTQQELHRIKEWGFHFVYSNEWWWHLESETGDYNQDNLHEVGPYLNMCAEEGIYWIYRFRVSFSDEDPPDWQGWTRAWYVCTEEGLQRYCNMLEWGISELEANYPNIVAYHLWQFPFHKASPTQEQTEFYYHSVIPTMVAAARNQTNKPLIVSSIGCKPEEFTNLQKVEDDNIIYGFTYYKPQVHDSSPDPVWEGTRTDIDDQWNMLQNAVTFMVMYDVPISVVEFGIRRDRIDQINKLLLKLQIFDYYDFSGWCYWEYSWYDDDGFCICYSNGVICKWGIVETVRRYRDWYIGI